MTSSLSIILTLFANINIIQCTGSIQECTNFEQCANTQIGQRQIICSGDSSCQQAVDLQARTSVQCSGSKSCHQSVDLQATKNVKCTGYDSCSDIPFIKGSVVSCHGEQSCKQSVPSSAISVSADKLYCNGRAACLQANIYCNSTVQCNGQVSCNATTIYSYGDVNCWGNRACSYSSITTPQVVQCYGYRACYGSTITSASEVKIHGVASGDFIHIIGVPRVEAYSGFTLSQAIIDSGSSSSMDVELFGVSLDIYHESTQVICRSGATCLLVCKDNGCHTLEYRCETGATCKIQPILCLQNPSGGMVKGRDCPHIIHENEIQKTDIDIDIGTDIGTGTGTFIARDFTMCNNESICVGQRIEDRNDGIMCGGKSSCESAVLLASNKDKVIGCNGESSCSLARIESSDTLYCWGERSCEEATVFSAGDIQCLGADACANIILSITKSISSPFLECGSYRGCVGVNMKGNSKEIEYIECNGMDSCISAEFEVGNSILCEGGKACQYTTLISGGNIQCVGYLSCAQSTLIMEEYIFLKGSYAAYNSIIRYKNSRNTDHTNLPIKAEGFKALHKAIIDSDVSSSIIIQLLGHLAGYEATVICRRASVCTVVCHTTGCKMLDFICEENAICNVRPVGCNGTVSKSDGVGCPNILTGATPVYIEQILQRKKIEREKYELLEEFDVLIGDEMNMNMNMNMTMMQQIMSLTYSQLLLGGIVCVLCVFSLAYLWYKLKYIEYHPLK